MESDRRKKKNNKKKKHKQATTLTESVTIDGRESTSDTQNHVVEMDRDMEVQFTGATDASTDVGQKMDSDTDGQISNVIEEASLAKADEQYWIDREASFEEKIKQVLAEKVAQMQKEAILEDNIKDLLREKDEYLQKLACQEETIRQLHSEKIVFIQKEDMLEERYKQLQMEKDAYLQKEISTEESIAALSIDSKNLRAQVMELEESRKSLLKEKQELTEKVSSLQLQINNLESTITYSDPNMNNIVISEDGNADHQREDMHPPAENLVPENPEQVEKVNGTYADSLPVGSNPGNIAVLSAGDHSTAPAQDFALGAEGRKMMPTSHSTRSFEEVMVNFLRNLEGMNGENGSGQPKSSVEIVVADEIVPTPLGENQTEDASVEDYESMNGENGSGPPKSSVEIVEADEIVPTPLGENQTEDASVEVYEKNDASFIDAPLIGAPFRFISFVARYVSGADLVDKNAENSV